MSSRTRSGFVALALGLAVVIAAACDSSSDAPIPASDAGTTAKDSAPMPAVDASCSSDLTTDPMNCGACAHVCGPMSACAASRCAPVTLGEASAPITALAVGLSSVFVASKGLYACGKDGCANGAPSLLHADALVNDGLDTTTEPGAENVLFTVGGASGHVARCDTGACGETALTTPQSFPRRLVAVKEATYFATDFVVPSDAGAVDAGDAGEGGSGSDGGDAGALPNGAIGRVAINAQGATPAFVAPAHRVLGFSFAGNTVAWADDQSGVSICTHPCASATPAFTVATGMTAPPAGRPAISSGTLYWPTTEGAIVSCSLTQCASTLTLLVAPSPGVYFGDLAADNETLYISVVTTTNTTSRGKSGAIAKCSLATAPCTPELLADGLDLPNHVAIDGAYAFFATGSGSSDGAIAAGNASALMRIAR